MLFPPTEGYFSWLERQMGEHMINAEFQTTWDSKSSDLLLILKYDGTALKVGASTGKLTPILWTLTSQRSRCSDVTQYGSVQERQVSNGVE